MHPIITDDRYREYCKKNTPPGNHVQLEYPEPILTEELAAALRKMEKHKSLGADNIITEMLVATGGAGTDILRTTCHLI